MSKIDELKKVTDSRKPITPVKLFENEPGDLKSQEESTAHVHTGADAHTPAHEPEQKHDIIDEPFQASDNKISLRTLLETVVDQNARLRASYIIRKEHDDAFKKMVLRLQLSGIKRANPSSLMQILLDDGLPRLEKKINKELGIE